MLLSSLTASVTLVRSQQIVGHTQRDGNSHQLVGLLLLLKNGGSGIILLQLS